MENKNEFFQNSLKYIEKLTCSHKGVTLIELIVVVAVASVLLTPLIGTFTAGYKAFYREDENVKVTRCARTAMERVVDAVRKADVTESTKGEGKDAKMVYTYNIKYVSGKSIKMNDETIIDEKYAFDDIDGADELKEKKLGIEIYYYDTESKMLKILEKELPEGEK